MLNSTFSEILHTALALYFGQESNYPSIREIPLDEKELYAATGQALTWEETIVLLLALMPHLNPQALDLFFIQNKNLDRPYTEFGGWKGTSHNGFLPTGETAAFLLGTDDPDNRLRVMQLFSKDHWFYRQNILRLNGQGEGEPFLSGKLCISEEFLSKVLKNGDGRPDDREDFPAKRITTPLNWEDLVLPGHIQKELQNISGWLQHAQEICSRWNLNKYVNPGCRCLFYGPPGTGKTLTAALLGKQHTMDVYRIDASIVMSSHTDKTKKSIAEIFDLAEHKRWILFFDEADKLFGTNQEDTPWNNRQVSQEILAYLFQRIEDFPGMVIMEARFKSSPDKEFFRYFQHILRFPVPDKNARISLWRQIIPEEWLYENKEELLQTAAETELSAGSIINVIRHCALAIFTSGQKQLTKDILNRALAQEKEKHSII